MKLRIQILPALLGALASAYAGEMTYTIQAYGTGSLGTDTFINQPITIVATGDSGEVISAVSGIYDLLLFPGAATIGIDGIGTATLNISSASVFADQTDQVAGFRNGSNDVLHIPNARLSSYDLSTPIGPLAGPAYGPITTLSTSTGLLNLQSFAPTPYGTFTAAPAPEPPSAALSGLSLGLVLIAVSRQRRGAKVTKA